MNNNDNNKVYHNTTGLEGDTLAEATENAIRLKELIREIFRKDPNPKTPFEVSVILVKTGHKYPITSIRARMTYLTHKEKFLVMSPKADAKGEYNAPNHTWKLRLVESNLQSA